MSEEEGGGLGPVAGIVVYRRREVCLPVGGRTNLGDELKKRIGRARRSLFSQYLDGGVVA